MDQAESLRNIIKQNRIVDAEGSNTSKARVITVTSGKGGVGKSSVSINLAIQFTNQGKKVIIFDADFGLANIEVMFGAMPKYNLSDMIFRGKELKEIIVEGPMGIGFISGGSGINGLANMSKEQVLFLVNKLKELEEMADVIIVDTGAGIADTVLDFLVASTEIILVTTPEPTSITDSYALLKSLNLKEDFDREQTDILVIANRVSDFEDGKNLCNKLEVVVSKFLNIKLKYLGEIPNDNHIQKSVMQQKPVSIAYPNSAGARAFVRIIENLTEVSNGEKKEKKGLAKAISNMFKNIQKKQ